MDIEPNNIDATLLDYDSHFMDLEAAMVEPALKKTTDIARSYNADILRASSDELSFEFYADLVNDMDTSLAYFVGEECLISGYIQYKDDDDKLSRIYVEDVPAKYNGFTVTSGRVGDYISEDLSLDHPKLLQHSIIFPISNLVNVSPQESLSDERPASTYCGVVGILDEVIIEFSSPSLERSKAWLELSYPDTMNEIDLAVFNAEENLDASLLSLASVELDLDGVDDVDLLGRCLKVYVNEITPVDYGIPYGMYFEGVAFSRDIHDPEKFNKIELDVSVLAYVLGVRLVNVTNNGKSMIIFGIDVSVVGENRDDPNTELLVPLKSVAALKSIRDGYYDTSN